MTALVTPVDDVDVEVPAALADRVFGQDLYAKEVDDSPLLVPQKVQKRLKESEQLGAFFDSGQPLGDILKLHGKKELPLEKLLEEPFWGQQLLAPKWFCFRLTDIKAMQNGGGIEHLGSSDRDIFIAELLFERRQTRNHPVTE